MHSFYQHKNNIDLRKIDEIDLPQLLSLKNESWFGTVQTACLNMSDQRKWFEKISSDRSCLYFIIQEGGFATGLYGITDIDWINQSCGFSHSIYKDFRGRGLGKRSLRAAIDMTFEVFNMRRIETWILSNNVAEIRTVRHTGFIEEGCKRKAVYKCGDYLDCILFGLLREDWNRDQSVTQYRDITNVCNRSYLPKNQTPTN